MAHRLSYSVACAIFMDQGWNPCVLHWQVDSLPLSYQGSSHLTFNFLSWVFYFFQLSWWILDKYNCAYLKYVTWWLHFKDLAVSILGFPGGSVLKNLPASAGDMGSIPGSGGSPGGENANPLQYSCLENPMDRGAWQAIVHGIAKGCLYLFISQQ